MKRTYYPQSPDKLLHVRRAGTVLQECMDSRKSPFLRIKNIFRGRIYNILLYILESKIGTELYTENNERELALFSKPVRRILAMLYESKKITGWEVQSMSSYYPKTVLCKIKPESVQLPDQTLATDRSLIVSGVSQDLDTAMKIATAEFFERDAVSEWDPSQHIRSTYKNIEKKAIDPRELTFGINQDILGDLQKAMWWTQVYSVLSGKHILIPSQFTYIFYQRAFPRDPFLHAATTNGVAAHTTKERALVRAFYELVERDAFLKYWLTKTTPYRIDISSIKTPDPSVFLDQLDRHELEVYLLDCSTEYSLPVFVMVLIDRKRSAIVRVSGEAGYDIERMIKKLFQEIFKWLHFIPISRGGYVWGRDFSNIRNMEDRSNVWSQSALLENVDFLISGEEISFQDYVSKLDSANCPKDIPGIREFLRKNGLEGYEIDQTTAISKANGLHVCRYIIPSMLPLYFQEERKPIYSTRLQNFHINLGISNTVFHTTEINMTPHPFL